MPWTRADADLLRLSVEQQFKTWQRKVFYGLGRKSGKSIAARNFMEQSRYAQRLTERMFRELLPEVERKVTMPIGRNDLTEWGHRLHVETKSGLTVSVNELIDRQENQRADLVKKNKTIVDFRSSNSRIIMKLRAEVAHLRGSQITTARTTISDLEDECNKLRRRNEQLTKRVQGAMDRTSKISDTLTEYIGNSPDHSGCNVTIELFKEENTALRQKVEALESTVKNDTRMIDNLVGQVTVMGDVAVEQSELIVHPEHMHDAPTEIHLRGQQILKLCHRAHERNQQIKGLRESVQQWKKKHAASQRIAQSFIDVMHMNERVHRDADTVDRKAKVVPTSTTYARHPFLWGPSPAAGTVPRVRGQ